MFDVGFSELLIIAVVALLVLGPERLPKAARLAGLWVRRARAQWYSVKSELERELAQEDLKRQLSEPLDALKPQMQALQQQLRDDYDGLDPGLPERIRLDDSPATPAVAEANTVEALADAWEANRDELETELDLARAADLELMRPGDGIAADTSAAADAPGNEGDSVPVQGDLLDPAPRRRT
jgi:sec-independent protein translocase protein TatB